MKLQRYGQDAFPEDDGCFVDADEAEAEIARLTEDRDLWRQSEKDCAKANRELEERLGNSLMEIARLREALEWVRDTHFSTGSETRTIINAALGGEE